MKLEYWLFVPFLYMYDGNENTHDWNYDKPYEWGLETLTETTFIKNL